MVSLVMSGCAGWQLKVVTVDVASSVNALYTEQAVTNMKRFIEDRDTIPSQVDISTGTVTLQNQASLGISIPYGNTVQRDVITLSQGTITNNPETINPGVSGYWQAAWTITPVGDAVTLSRLRALYKYVTSNERFITIEEERILLARNPQEDQRDYMAALVLMNEYEYDISAALSYGTIYDVSRLLEPRCVICLSREEIAHLPRPKVDPYERNAVQAIVDLHKYLKDERLVSELKGRMPDLENRILAEHPRTTVDSHIIVTSHDPAPPFYINPSLNRVRIIKVGERCSENGYVYLGRKDENELCISKTALSYFVLFLLPQGDARSQMSPPGAPDTKK
jgi:hypothetical protein